MSFNTLTGKESALAIYHMAEAFYNQGSYEEAAQHYYDYIVGSDNGKYPSDLRAEALSFLATAFADMDDGIKVAAKFMKKTNALFFDLPITTRMISSPGALTGTISSDVDPFEIRFFNKTTFKKASNTYRDLNPSHIFYRIPFDSNRTVFDSTAYQGVTNEFGVSLVMKGKLTKSLSLSYDKALQYYQSDTMADYSHYSDFLHAVLGVRSERTTLYVDSKLGIRGYYASNYIHDFTLEHRFSKYFSLGSHLFVKQVRPSYLYNHYQSDLYSWDHELEDLQVKYASVYAKLYKFRIAAFSRLLNHYYYISYKGFAESVIDDLVVSGIELNRKFEFGRFELDNNLLYQQSSDVALQAVPKIIANHSLLVNFQMMKGTLKSKFGLELTYHSAYFADGYYPYHGNEYGQLNTKTGGYPYLDVFIATAFKRANVFVKFQHVNAGLSGYDYFVTETYPNTQRIFRFGIAWRFWE